MDFQFERQNKFELLERASSSPGEVVKKEVKDLVSQREIISSAPFEKETIASVSFERETITPSKSRNFRSKSSVPVSQPILERLPAEEKEKINSSVAFEKEVPRTRSKTSKDDAIAFRKDTFSTKPKRKRPASIKDFKLYRQFSDRKKSAISVESEPKNDGGKSPITMLRDLSKSKKKREVASVCVASPHHSQDVADLHKVIALEKQIGEIKSDLEGYDTEIEKTFGNEKEISWADLVLFHISLRMKIMHLDETKGLGLRKKLSFSVVPRT